MLSSHVTSLDLSRKLRDAGVPQVSEFSWVKSPREEKYTLMAVSNDGRTNLLANGYDVVSAFLSSELGEMLKESIYPLPVMEHKTKKWFVPVNGWDLFNGKYFDTECEARALMLLHLISSGIINPKALK